MIAARRYVVARPEMLPPLSMIDEAERRAYFAQSAATRDGHVPPYQEYKPDDSQRRPLAADAQPR